MSVVAVVLVRVLQQVLSQARWMSARAALGPWGWCPDKRAPIKLKRWLKKLAAVDILSSDTAHQVEQCFAIRQVCSFWPVTGRSYMATT